MMEQGQQVHMGQMTNGETHKDDFPLLGGQGKDVSQRSYQILSKITDKPMP